MQIHGKMQSLSLLVGALLVLAGCSTTQQGQQGEYNEYSGNYENYGDYENDAVSEGGNEYGYGSESGNYGSNYANYNYSDGEAFNSDITNDTDAYADIGVTENAYTDTVDATLNASGGYSNSYNTYEATPAPVNYAAQPAATNYAQPMAPVATVPSGATAPVPGGRVRYVVQGGAAIVDQGGAPVGALSQGDHPVTWEENGMYRITQGMYVPTSAMSDQGVPRAMPGGVWK